ncbi:hypothetical protein MD588_08935 [Photobacterium sp. SDRW27]|uniref:hypothetical protein n=1 Tax=Photobacterium obscurum TaxID=2829490 RepID=UPI002244DFA9|nr:hypothetical protein [Photobacterium obscurum]MCW8328933.1 hypothetical protein [Photobacterium obscurum]
MNAVKTLIALGISITLIGCGGGGSSDGTPSTSATFGDLSLRSIELNKYKAIGSIGVDESTDINSYSVGITTDDAVEAVAVDFNTTDDTGNIITSPSVCEAPVIDLLTVEPINDEWQVILAKVPTFMDTEHCGYFNYQEKYYFQHQTMGLFELPENIRPIDSHAKVDSLNAPHDFYIIPANSSHNKGSNLLMGAENPYKSTEQSLYEIILPTSENQDLTLNKIIPNAGLRFTNNQSSFVFANDSYVYAFDAHNHSTVNKIEKATGKIVDHWTWDSISIPFEFEGQMYTTSAIGGDNSDIQYQNRFVALQADGGLGETLEIPGDRNVYNTSVSYVIDDRFIISNLCQVWDMQANSVLIGLDDGFNGQNMHINNGTLYCAGTVRDENTQITQQGGLSLELNTAELHTTTVENREQISKTLKLETPFLTYRDATDNVNDTEYVTINLNTKEKSVEVHSYNGQRVYNLKSFDPAYTIR